MHAIGISQVANMPGIFQTRGVNTVDHCAVKAMDDSILCGALGGYTHFILLGAANLQWVRIEEKRMSI